MDWVSFLAAHNLKHSMSRCGNRYDNAVVESFFKTGFNKTVMMAQLHAETSTSRSRLPLILSQRGSDMLLAKPLERLGMLDEEDLKINHLT